MPITQSAVNAQNRAYWNVVKGLGAVAIKLVDLAYAALIGETDPAVYGVFVCAYPYQCWLLYALAGTFLPVLLAMGWDRLYAAVRRRFPIRR